MSVLRSKAYVFLFRFLRAEELRPQARETGVFVYEKNQHSVEFSSKCNSKSFTAMMLKYSIELESCWELKTDCAQLTTPSLKTIFYIIWEKDNLMNNLSQCKKLIRFQHRTQDSIWFRPILDYHSHRQQKVRAHQRQGHKGNIAPTKWYDVKRNWSRDHPFTGSPETRPM